MPTLHIAFKDGTTAHEIAAFVSEMIEKQLIKPKSLITLKGIPGTEQYFLKIIRQSDDD